MTTERATQPPSTPVNRQYVDGPWLEEGRAGLDEKNCIREDVASPTAESSAAPTLVSRDSFPVQAIKKISTWPTRVMSSLSEAREEHAKSRDKIRVHRLEDYPCGYPRVACFEQSDEQFMIYRRFGYVHSRLLLYKQDQLRKLEESLHAMDLLDSESEKGLRRLRSRRMDDARKNPEGEETRKELLARIETLTLEYGRLLLQAQQLVAMNKPADRDHASVRNYLENDPDLLADGDNEYIYHKEDLVTLRSGREHAWLDAFVERSLKLLPQRPVKYLFCSEETQLKCSDDSVQYFTRSRINMVVTSIITMIILVLLVVPIYALFTVTVTWGGSVADRICIGVLLVSTLVFSSVLSLFTKARRHEILAAAAGYCAVLVVFVGNVGANNSPQSAM